MRNNKSITDALRRQIIDEYLAGASKYSLTKKYALSDARLIIVWMRKLGIEIPKELQKKRIVINKKATTLTALKEENLHLKQALAKERAQVTTYISRIEAAERMYGIKIR